jgi:hypothetical protein
MGKKKVIESVSREKEDVSIAIAGRNLTWRIVMWESADSQ